MDNGFLQIVARLRGRGAGDQAGSMARQIREDDRLCVPIAAAGALPLLVALLQSNDKVTQAHAADALSALAKDDAIRQSIVEARAVPALVGLLRFGISVGKSNAARALAWLSEDASHRALIVAEGALAPLVDLLRSGTEDGKSYAVAVIGDLAQDVPTRAVIVKEGALPLLVDLLRSGTQRDKTNAAYAIGWLAQYAPTRALILSELALAPLVKMLRSNMDGGKSYAAFALAWLSEDLSARTLIVETGVMPPLVALLRTGTDDGKSNATLTISRLAQDAPTRTLIVKEGALTLLAKMLRTGNEDDKMNATRAMLWIAHDEPHRARILDADALPSLIALLSPSRASDLGAGKNVCGILEHLFVDARLRELVGQHGAAGTLAAAAYSRGCAWASEARTLLLVLCPTQEDSGRALMTMHLKCAELSAERDAAASSLESFASLAGPVAKGHDVVFCCTDGERIGGIRLLIARASPHYERMYLGGTESAIVEPDLDFSSAAHRAMLGQLHAMGNAVLPAKIEVRLELLSLAAKVRTGGGGGDGGGEEVAARVLERCKRGVVDSLCADNCLTVLLQLKPYTTEMPELFNAAITTVTRHVAEVLKQPEWHEFAKLYPESALAIMLYLYMSVNKL